VACDYGRAATQLGCVTFVIYAQGEQEVGPLSRLLVLYKNEGCEVARPIYLDTLEENRGVVEPQRVCVLSSLGPHTTYASARCGGDDRCAAK
jgi:hypothetical protein